MLLPSGTLKQSLTDTTPRIPEATRMTALGGTINCAFVPSLSQSLRPTPTIHIRHIRTAPTLQLQTPHIYTRPQHIPWRRLCRLWTRVWTTWGRDWPVSNCPPSALTPTLRWSAVGAASSAVSGCIHENETHVHCDCNSDFSSCLSVTSWKRMGIIRRCTPKSSLLYTPLWDVNYVIILPQNSSNIITAVKAMWYIGAQIT